MYCIHCGTQIPDNSTFCSKCGKPQFPRAETDEHKWETCEICFEPPFLMSYGYYWAKAEDPDGEYNAGESPGKKEISSTQSPENAELVKALIARLLQEEWEQIDSRSTEWYSYQFRRRLTRDCPRCTSIISIKATRCPKCTSEIPAIVRQRKEPPFSLFPDIPVIVVPSKPSSTTIPTATPPFSTPSATDAPQKQESTVKKDKSWLRKLFGG